MTITALGLLLALQTLSVSAARRLGGLHQVGGGKKRPADVVDGCWALRGGRAARRERAEVPVEAE